MRPRPEALIGAFLGDDRFLLVSPNAYNGLGVGTTQLYNTPVVYNHKRHGIFELDGRPYDFRLRPSFPKQVSEEFLLVDLLHNAERLAEDSDAVSPARPGACACAGSEAAVEGGAGVRLRAGAQSPGRRSLGRGRARRRMTLLHELPDFGDLLAVTGRNLAASAILNGAELLEAAAWFRLRADGQRVA